MPTLRERATSAAIGLVGTAAGLAVVWLGYAIFPPAAAGWAAVGAGLLVLVGLTAALAAFLMLFLPALLPVR